VAGSLGEAQLQLTVDDAAFRSGLQRAQQEAAKTGSQIQKALQARQTKVDSNNQLINRLQKEALTADASRAALIRQRIGFIRAENAEQQRGIAVLKAKLASNKQLTAELGKQVATQVKEAALQAKASASALQKQAALQAAASAAVADGAVNAFAQIPGLGGALTTAAGGWAALAAGMVAATATAVAVADDFARLRQQIDLMSGSAENTAAVLAQLKQYAAATPFDLPELADNAKLLMAYGLEAKDAVEFTKRLGDAATVTQVPLDRLALNFGQIISMGRAYTVDLRQFALAGIPIFEALAEVTGKASREIREMDVIPSDLIVQAFRKMTEEGGKFYQGGIKGGTALSRETATLQDAVKELGEAWGKIFTPTAVDAITTTSKAIGLVSASIDAVRKKSDELGNNPGFKLLTTSANWLSGRLALEGIGNAIKGIDAVVQKGKPPAPRLTRTGQTLEEKAAEQRALAFAQAYNDEKKQSLKASQDSVAQARVAAAYEGEALRIAQAQLAVEQAKRDARQASELAAKDPNDGKLRAQAEAAGQTLVAAQVQAGQAMKEAAKNAADQLKQAGDQLKNTLRSNLDLLNAGIRQKVIDDARKSLNTSLATGRYDNQAVLSQVKTNQDLLDMATKLEGINADFDNYSKAQDNVARVQEQMGVSFAELGIKLDTTAAEIAALAKKDWTVYVNGSSVSSYGEMVSAMNRGMQ